MARGCVDPTAWHSGVHRELGNVPSAVSRTLDLEHDYLCVYHKARVLSVLVGLPVPALGMLPSGTLNSKGLQGVLHKRHAWLMEVESACALCLQLSDPRSLESRGIGLKFIPLGPSSGLRNQVELSVGQRQSTVAPRCIGLDDICQVAVGWRFLEGQPEIQALVDVEPVWSIRNVISGWSTVEVGGFPWVKEFKAMPNTTSASSPT